MATAARFGRAQSFGRAVKPVPQRASAGAAVAAAAPIVESVPVAEPRIAVGALTIALMAVLTVIFFCELRFSGSSGAAVNDHYFNALGGLGWNFFAGHHEWWRFFTAPWLHADSGHIIGNGIALVITGWLLERLIGRAWLLAAFFVGAWGGSIASLIMTPASILVSLGASGAIMGLVALLFTVSFHSAASERSAKRYRRWAMFLLIPALLPSVPGDGMAIDVGAHFGGAVAGTAFGFLLLIIWPENGARPPFVWAAGAFAAIGLALTGGAFYLAAQSFPVYAADAGQLAPRTLLVDDDKANRSGELVTLYPHDPLAHMVRALHLNAQHDVTGALGEVRAGLDQTRALDTYYPAALRFHMRVMLVLLLLQDNRSDDARTEAAPICPIIRDPARWPERDGGLKTGIAFVRDNHICD